MSPRGGGQTPYLQWACCSPRPGSPRLAWGRVPGRESFVTGEVLGLPGPGQKVPRFLTSVSSDSTAATFAPVHRPPTGAPGGGKNLGYQAQSLQ